MTATDPKLVYVELDLKVTRTSSPVPVRALHDSGCAKTIMSTNTYHKLHQTQPIHLKKLKNVSISSCTGEKTRPMGYVSVYMAFSDNKGNTLMFPFDILVHEALDHDMLLGRDFTGSRYKSFETNSHIYLTDADPTLSLIHI